MSSGAPPRGPPVRQIEGMDRHQNVVDFALHVARRALLAVTQEPRDFAQRLGRRLIGDAMDQAAATHFQQPLAGGRRRHAR